MRSSNPYRAPVIENPVHVVMFAGSEFDGVTYVQEQVVTLEADRAAAAIEEGKARPASL